MCYSPTVPRMARTAHAARKLGARHQFMARALPTPKAPRGPLVWYPHLAVLQRPRAQRVLQQPSTYGVRSNEHERHRHSTATSEYGFTKSLGPAIS